ncbi:unnamed protein product [Brassica oleracea var. botrytis]
MAAVHEQHSSSSYYTAANKTTSSSQENLRCPTEPEKINDCHVLKVSDVSLDKYDDHYFGKKVSTHREKDDQMAVDGALIKAIEVVSEKILLGLRERNSVTERALQKPVRTGNQNPTTREANSIVGSPPDKPASRNKQRPKKIIPN